MKTRRLFAALRVAGSLLVAATVAQAQDPFMLGNAGGVEVWSVPQADPADGIEAANIVLRSPAGTKIVTFENLLIDGDVHQVWLSGPFAAPTAKGAPVAGPTYDASWIPLDSHLLIESSMVGGGAGGSYGEISETNDGSNGELGLPPASGFPPSAGFGPIQMKAATDAFFLDTPFQSNEVNLAYLVSPKDAVAAGGTISLTLGVLGEGIVNSGEAGGAFFDALPVSLSQVPEPASGLMALMSLLGLGLLRRKNG